MPIAPTLILGLGGTGSQIIEKVSAKIQETNRAQSDRIAFVAFDTDINDLSGIKRRSPSMYTVQTSTRSTVGEYLNVNHNARDNWFPVNEMLNRKTLTEGAAQVRAISRLAFDTTLKGGNLDGLHKAIDHLFRIDKDQEEQALRVIIASSLAGGTGSGLILPVAMYLSNYLRTKYPKAKAITRGFFVQPDVFFTVIKATEEQRNLQVNAYAAVRELDAFLMKGDNTLPEQYRNLAFEFPRVAAEGVEEINSMPYDFCFLFDANNSSGGALDSFESYKDHAATCIYTQSLGPMSKKSNSREDNVLREVILNDGRNRYAGAGASRLVYPWEHIRDYVAYKWTDLALSKQWLKFDEQIKEKREALAKQNEEGFVGKDIQMSREYVQLVDAAAENKDPFARSIKNQCLAYDDDGITLIGERWNEYLTALRVHVKKQSAQAGDDNRKRNVNSKIAALSESKEPEDYLAVYKEIDVYFKTVEKKTDESAGVIAYSLFRAEKNSVTGDRLDHQLETYLRSKTVETFIHPVSSRYFLYQTLQSLEAEKHRVDLALGKIEKFFAAFEKATFAVQDGEEYEGPEQFVTRKQSFRSKLSRKPSHELQQMAGKFQNYVTKVDAFREETVYAKVLQEAIQYVKDLCESFEIMFNNLDSNLSKLHTQIEMHRTKFDNLKGSTTRYVLASSEALDYMYKSMQYSGGVLTIDSDLSSGIYDKVRQYAMLTDDKEGSFFQELYNEKIIGFFRDDVSRRHQAQLEFDIIEALEREYKSQTKNFEEHKVSHYVTDEIDKVKNLAAPFLEQPLGEERHPIQACAYNPKLEGESDPKRKSLIAEHLGNYGGERDEDISPQEILFYNAMYGIRASDLSKYAPAREFETDRRPAGSYFSAYYQLVSQIKPSVSETRVITPHIDRRWHTLAALPDLDEGYQAIQLKAIHVAFISGLILKTIKWDLVYGDYRLYRYTPHQGVDQDFMVTNGTPCDHFYEVLDALTINPVAVTEVSEANNWLLKDFMQENNTANFLGSPIERSLSAGIHLGELSEIVPALRGRRMTVFDVPAFYSISAPKDELFEGSLRSLSANIIAYCINEIERLEEPERVIPTIENLLREQFNEFQSHIDLYKEVQGEIFGRKVRTILKPLVESMREYRIRRLASTVDSYLESLTVSQ